MKLNETIKKDELPIEPVTILLEILGIVDSFSGSAITRSVVINVYHNDELKYDLTTSIIAGRIFDEFPNVIDKIRNKDIIKIEILI